jgi:hypothetical protein
VIEKLGLFLGKHDNPAGLVSEFLEHLNLQNFGIRDATRRKGALLGLFAQGVSALCALFSFDLRVSVSFATIRTQNRAHQQPNEKTHHKGWNQ